MSSNFAPLTGHDEQGEVRRKTAAKEGKTPDQGVLTEAGDSVGGGCHFSLEVGGEGIEDAGGWVGGRVGLAEFLQGVFGVEAVAVHEVGDYCGGAAADGGFALDEDGHALSEAGVDEGHDVADSVMGPRGVVGEVDVEDVGGVLRRVTLTNGETSPMGGYFSVAGVGGPDVKSGLYLGEGHRCS